MRQYDLLDSFMEKALADCRISKGHIALYLSLFYLWNQVGCNGALAAYGAQVMPVAKISSTATYHRLLRDLADFGYLRYEPSFYKSKPSKIYFN